MTQAIPCFVLLVLFLFQSRCAQGQHDQKKQDLLISKAIQSSEELCYQGDFAEAQHTLDQMRFTDSLALKPWHRLELNSQFFRVEIFKNDLSQNNVGLKNIVGQLRKNHSLASITENSVSVARYFHVLATAYLYTSQLDSAGYYYGRAQVLFNKCCDYYSAAGSRAFLILVRHQQLRRLGDVDQIIHLIPEYEKEIAFAKEADNKLALAYNLRHLGRIYYNQVKDLGKATTLYQASLALRKEIGFQIYIPASHSSMGDIHIARGDCEKATEAYHRSIKAAESLKFVRYMVHPRIKIGDIHREQCVDEQAIKYYRDAHRVASLYKYTAGVDESWKRIVASWNE